MLTAWRWTAEHAGELGVGSLAIGGASAGANLAAGAVLRLLREGRTPLPSSVVLIYPTLLAVQPAPDPALRAALDADPAADVFGPAAVRRTYETYLGGPVDDAPVGAVPGRASEADLAGFPPALVVNAEVDELRLSGVAFAAALNGAGRRAHEVVEPGTIHGYLNRPALPAASRTLDRVADWLRSPRLEPYQPGR